MSKSDIIDFVKKIRVKVPAATHSLVGPASVYSDDKVLVISMFGQPGQPSFQVGLDLGNYEADPSEESDGLYAAADTVLWIRKAGGITMKEARGLRETFIDELRRSGFVQVTPYDSALALLTANAALFPGAAADKKLATLQAEMREAGALD